MIGGRRRRRDETGITKRKEDNVKIYVKGSSSTNLGTEGGQVKSLCIA
jgi:hypothetical protein